GGVVDPDRHQLAAPAAGVQRGRHVAPRRLLGRRGDRVLQIEEHLVGGQAAGLVQEPLAAARHRQAGAPGSVLFRHCFRPPAVHAALGYVSQPRPGPWRAPSLSRRLPSGPAPSGSPTAGWAPGLAVGWAPGPAVGWAPGPAVGWAPGPA